MASYDFQRCDLIVRSFLIKTYEFSKMSYKVFNVIKLNAEYFLDEFCQDKNAVSILFFFTRM